MSHQTSTVAQPWPVRELPSMHRSFWGRVVAFFGAPFRPLAEGGSELELLFYPVILVVLVIQPFLPRRHATLQGPVLSTRRGWRRRTIDISAATSVALDPNATLDNGVTLVLERAGQKVELELFADAVAHRRSQPAWVLRHLCEALRANRSVHPDEVVAWMERQADHLDAGGGRKDSPLRELRGTTKRVAADPTGPSDERVGLG